jgi:sugar lactone lactonase YvrE
MFHHDDSNDKALATKVKHARSNMQFQDVDSRKLSEVAFSTKEHGLKLSTLSVSSFKVMNKYMSFLSEEEGTEAYRMSDPGFPTVDSNLNLWVTTAGKNYLTKVSLKDGKEESFGDNDEYPRSNEENLDLREIGGLAIDSAGHVYMADVTGCVIRELTHPEERNIIGIYAGQYKDCGYGGEGTLVTNPETIFNEPTDLALDHNGYLYVSDSGSSVIRKIDTSTNVVTTFFGKPTVPYYAKECTLIAFRRLDGITVDHEGNVYAADGRCGYILKITPDKKASVFVGGGSVPASQGTPSNQVKFNYIGGLAFDKHRRSLYVSDVLGNAIYMVDDKETHELVGKRGLIAYDGLKFPRGVAVEQKSGNVYIADTANNCIREVAKVL